jgi:hypothetical protein
MWHLSAYVRRYDILEIPLALPYVPFAYIVDPHEAMSFRHDYQQAFWFALANWFVIFLIGAAFSLRRISTRLTGSATMIAVLVIALCRAYEALVIHPPPPVP